MTMTYEELQKMNADLEKQADKLYRQQTKNELKYIAEHEPFKVHRYQILNVRLRVTKETRMNLSPSGRKMKKNQLGHEYTVTGCFIGWLISKERGGELRPCFFGGITYSRFDEIVSIEPGEQIEGHCSKCREYKDGYCYMMGGKDISVKCATHKVKKDDYTCPKYEELTELWDKQGERHYPNVTICKHCKPIHYNIYALNWGSYWECPQEVIDSNYTFENPNK